LTGGPGGKRATRSLLGLHRDEFPSHQTTDDRTAVSRGKLRGGNAGRPSLPQLIERGRLACSESPESRAGLRRQGARTGRDDPDDPYVARAGAGVQERPVQVDPAGRRERAQPPQQAGPAFRGTQPFQAAALLPRLGESRFSPLSLVFTIVAFALVVIALRGTFWGLKLKALGKNLRSAFLLGVSSEREAILAMLFCGALAGLGGAVRVLSWFDSLRQSISGGIGFLALLVVMLASFRVFWVPLIAFFFSAVLNGSITLQLRTQLHSSLGGILTGVMVLFVLLFGDLQKIGLGLRKKPHEQQ